MILNHVKTVSITSTLVLGLVGSFTFTPAASASETTASTQIIARETVASASFVTVEQDHPTQGKASIISENGQRYLVFDAAFTTAQGPDVQIILHRDSRIPVQVNEQDYITLAPLKSFDGQQRYALPNDLDLNQFKSVGIWCRKFNVTFGYAAL